MRVGVHGRKSLVVKEGTSAPSIAVQHEKGRAWARERGWTVAEYYAENVSAWSGKTRPEMDRALRDLMAGRIDVLWCFAVDRFSREGARAVLEIMDRPLEARPWIIFHTEGLDTRNDAYRLPLILMAEVALNYSNRLSMNIRAAKERSRRLGGWATKAPYGFRTVGPTSARRLQIDPDTWPIVQRIYTSAADGVSTRSIAQTLNNEGIPSPSGGLWTPTTVRRIILKPLYEGIQIATTRNNSRFTIVRDDDGHPIRVLPENQGIPPELAEKARSAMRGNDATRGTPRPGRPRHLLAGLLRCAGCGGGMPAHSHSYTCARHHRNRSCPAPASISRKILETHVVNAFLTRIPALEPEDPDDAAILVALAERWAAVVAPEETREAREARAAVEAAESALKRHMELEGRMAAVRDVWLARLDELAAELAAARDRASKLAPAAAADISFLLDGELLEETWRAAALADRRTYLQVAIDHIVVHRAPDSRVLGDLGSRVEIHWATSKPAETP